MGVFCTYDRLDCTDDETASQLAHQRTHCHRNVEHPTAMLSKWQTNPLRCLRVMVTSVIIHLTLHQRIRCYYGNFPCLFGSWLAFLLPALYSQSCVSKWLTLKVATKIWRFHSDQNVTMPRELLELTVIRN